MNGSCLNVTGNVTDYTLSVSLFTPNAGGYRIRSLYRGFVPKVLRLGPGGGILLVVYDTVSNWMKKYVVSLE